jgi:hypothetical protein
MTELDFDRSGDTAAGRGWREALGAARVPPAVAWAIAAIAALAVGRYLWTTEASLSTMIHAGSVCLAFAALMSCLTRRLLPAVVALPALVAIVIAAQTVKSRETNMLLHAYDLVLALGSPAAALRLACAYPGYTLLFAAGLAAALLAAGLARRMDRTVIGRRHAAIACAAFAATAVLAARASEERPHTLYYFWNIHLSSFFLSWPETLEALGRRSLIEAARQPTGEPRLAIPASCEPSRRPPHILLIHQESVVPPSLFPSLGYDPSLDALFRSIDGRQRTLRVETYGGASWLTEFSVLTGLSARSFGGMRQLVQPVMAGKVRDTLPDALARCGYRNVLLYPMLRSYTGAGRFFPAVGIPEVLDARDQKAKAHNERDRFYYANALDEIGRHVAVSGRPLFLYIQTSATHWPYTVTFAPEADVPGGAPGTHPEMHEYLRRLALARIDYAELRDSLARRFPGEPFLIVRYGDHQPTATRTLLGFGAEADIEDVMRRADPAAFLAYYAIDAVGFQPAARPADLQALDVPYLGVVLLEAAGLPLSDAFRERRRLMAVCGGRYHDCPDRQQILRFHRRLIESGIIDAL